MQTTGNTGNTIKTVNTENAIKHDTCVTFSKNAGTIKPDTQFHENVVINNDSDMNENNISTLNENYDNYR